MCHQEQQQLLVLRTDTWSVLSLQASRQWDRDASTATKDVSCHP